MDPQQPDNQPDAKQPFQETRPRALANNVQRFQMGSRGTNTLNTPPRPKPCYVHHMLISEQWPVPKDQVPRPKDENVQRDPVVISDDIRTKQTELDAAYRRLDNLLLLTDEYDNRRPEIDKKILEIQEELVKLDLERLAAQVELGPYQPPVGRREFVIVGKIPDGLKTEIAEAEIRLSAEREKLNEAYTKWFEAHTEHEAVKKELMGFTKKKKKLAEKRDKARTSYEAAILREKTESQDPTALDTTEKVRKFLRRSVRTKHVKAQQAKTVSRAELDAAIKAYDDFASHEFRRASRREGRLYQILIDELKKVHEITNTMGQIEAEVQEAKNTLESGATIQMISFERGYDLETLTNFSKKVPKVTVTLNEKTSRFPAEKAFCDDDPPRRNNGYLHPHIHLTEPKSKVDYHGSQPAKPAQADKNSDPPSRSIIFKIFERHHKIFQPVKTGVLSVVKGALTDVVEVLHHIFSFFPKKRNYLIVAEACGDPRAELKDGRSGKLEAKLEVFPADTYSISLKMKPAFGYDNTRTESVSNTTGIKGEAAYSDAENAASKADHTISQAESFSVMGVVQNSTTTSVTKSAAYTTDAGDEVGAREITTVSTLTRDGGVFGSQTSVDRSTGSFDGGETKYESTVERTETLGSPRTDGQKLKSMSQSYTDQDGVVTDASKEVDTEGMATAIEDDSSGEKAGVKGGRPPSVPSSYMPQIPIDIVLARNDKVDEITNDLRRTLGLIIFLVRKCADIAGRIGNMMPSMGWTYGFQMTFLTGSLAYTHCHKEHVDRRVWLNHRFDVNMNLISAKVFIFGGLFQEFLLFTFQLGIEANVTGNIGVKGHFENTHPDAKKKGEVGFGPTGGIGIGVEIKAVAGQPDWISATGSVESGISVEAIYWASKENEPSPYLDASFKWEGVKMKGVAHVILVGHWEITIPILDERIIWAGRFPKIQKEEEIKQMLEGQTADLAASLKKRTKEQATRESKFKKFFRFPKITK